MYQDQTERGIHVKRLRFLFAVSIACGGVTHLTQTDIAWQGPHIASAKHVAHHALGFVHEKLLLKLRDNARRVLPTVLQQQQGVVNELIHRCLTDHTHNAAHQNTQPSKGAGKKGLNNKTPW